MMGTFTYDPASDVGTVRLLISDVDAADYVFSNEEIGRFLTLEGDDPRLAAATALLTVASNEVLLLKYVRTHGLTLDGSKVADALRANAAQLRADANGDGDVGSFLIAGNTDGYDFTGPRRWR